MLNRLDLRGVGDLSEVLPRPAMAKEPPTQAVQAILADVRARGDAALRDHTERLDGVKLGDLRVPIEEIDNALESTPTALREALEEAHASIEAYHRHQRAAYQPRRYERQGVVVDELTRPVGRAGLYVPGGRARYPSTVLMTAVPARVAGVLRIALCVPPDAGGSVAEPTLAAAAIAGVDEVYRVGGAQAIGAMAYGTESIRAVDVIVGPGNIYVSEAKRQVSGAVGVPSAFAGPSEVVVLADDSTPIDLAAIDVVVQAEHGPDGLAWLVTWSEQVAGEVSEAVARLVAASPRQSEIEATLFEGGYAVLVEDPKRAIAVSNAIAPEHLELLCADPESLLPFVSDAGAVFTGLYAPASVGDYLAGPSHVLPTYGSARFAGALRVDDFLRHSHAISLDEGALARVAPQVAAIAESEGLAAHADSVRARHAGPAASEVKHTVQVRDDLDLVNGYHSPQVDVAVRLNTNESPIAPPRAWVEAVGAELERIEFHRYPDRRAWALRSALGEVHGVGPEEVFCANGSNEVLQCLLLAFGGPGRSVAVFEPTYALHSHIARVTGTGVATGERLADFRLDLDEARRVNREASPVVTFLCSPNNPTGRAEPREVVEEVLALAPGLVVVDEAYGQFSEWSALSMLARDARDARDDRLAVVRTFSKTWSMAAARLGYMVGPASLIAALEQVALPYHLDTIKQVAGRLALDYQADMDKRVAGLVEERARLSDALEELPVETWPSDANFILFRPLSRPAEEVWQGLLDRSVLVRNCASWPRLDGCLRVTVGTPEEDSAFLDALAECLGASRQRPPDGPASRAGLA